MGTKISVVALIEVTSLGSDGRGKILACAFKRMVARDHLTSPEFQNFNVGELVVARVQYTFESKRRVLKTIPEKFIVRDTEDVEVIERPGTVADFLRIFKDEIDKQSTEFARLAARFHPGDGVVPFDEPIIPAKLDEVVEAAKRVASKRAAVVDGWCDSFFVQDEERNAFSMAKTLSENLPAKVMIIGPSGYGKTSLPKAFAKQNGLNYVRFNVALVRDPEEFFGWRTVVDGDVKFIPSEFTKAISNGNAVVVLDELNRATPEMANALFPILDDDARTVVFGEEIKVGPNVIIVATINVGYQFVGTFAIDQALLNRMDITLRVAPLPKSVETEILVRRTGIDKERAAQVVAICNRLRDLNNDGKIIIDASTRTSIRVAKFVANGASFQDAFAWAIVNGADVEERKEIIDTISSVL